MDYKVSRALQISQLEPDEVDALHLVESRAKYCLPNWNIQKLFRKPELKTALDLPDHVPYGFTNRIADALNEKTEGGYLNELRVDEVHYFDDQVMAVKGNIIWEYTGKSKLGSLKKKFLGTQCFLIFA